MFKLNKNGTDLEITIQETGIDYIHELEVSDYQVSAQQVDMKVSGDIDGEEFEGETARMFHSNDTVVIEIIEGEIEGARFEADMTLQAWFQLMQTLTTLTA